MDRVIEYEQGKSAVGYKNVTINDEFFNGHFPGRPIMPGVLQVEAMAQLGGLVMLPDDGPAGARTLRFRLLPFQADAPMEAVSVVAWLG